MHGVRLFQSRRSDCPQLSASKAHHCKSTWQQGSGIEKHPNAPSRSPLVLVLAPGPTLRLTAEASQNAQKGQPTRQTRPRSDASWILRAAISGRELHETPACSKPIPEYHRSCRPSHTRPGGKGVLQISWPVTFAQASSEVRDQEHPLSIRSCMK